jgi:hypothetical protein
MTQAELDAIGDTLKAMFGPDSTWIVVFEVDGTSGGACSHGDIDVPTMLRRFADAYDKNKVVETLHDYQKPS